MFCGSQIDYVQWVWWSSPNPYLLDHDTEYPNTQTRPFLSEQVKEYHQRFTRQSKGRKWTIIKICKFRIVLARLTIFGLVFYSYIVKVGVYIIYL